ncbi:DnaJ domain-containing protein [Halopenitus sp. H-Gu1]|uniref:DnaJ domain-containing protein n=1 Tax=Halopenitus sp. H-Gu1 TaxID=3242697 RepID=UPI00359E3570
MSSIEWPTGFERTSADTRERNRSFEATIADTTSAIATEMDRMGVDDWRASTGSGGAYTLETGLPKHNANPEDPGFVLRWSDDGEQFAVACDAYSRLRDNLRTVYLWVHETRMRGQRSVKTGDAEFAAARLPPADETDDVVVADGATEAPHEVLEIQPDASEAVVKAAAREKKAEHHPDAGGDEQAFKRVVSAAEVLLDGE